MVIINGVGAVFFLCLTYWLGWVMAQADDSNDMNGPQLIVHLVAFLGLISTLVILIVRGMR